MRDTGIATRLRGKGLRVIEVEGWKTRGKDTMRPVGSIDHHTAGAATGNAPSLNVCINGRGNIPGPLCNVLVARDNTCYVVAAGTANHGGEGTWGGFSGNSRFYGVERENRGTIAEPWTDEQTRIASIIHAALIQGCARPDPALVCEHKEYATPPGRKVDAHSIDGDLMRLLVARALQYGHVSQEERMYYERTCLPGPEPTIIGLPAVGTRVEEADLTLISEFEGATGVRLAVGTGDTFDVYDNLDIGRSPVIRPIGAGQHVASILNPGPRAISALVYYRDKK